MARTLAWILLAQACGGSAPALTKLAPDGLGPWRLVVVRQLLGSLFLATLDWARGHNAPPAPFDGRDRRLLLVLAWAGFALPQILNAVGLELSTATHGALLIPASSCRWARLPLRLRVSASGWASARRFRVPALAHPARGASRR